MTVLALPAKTMGVGIVVVAATDEAPIVDPAEMLGVGRVVVAATDEAATAPPPASAGVGIVVAQATDVAVMSVPADSAGVPNVVLAETDVAATAVPSASAGVPNAVVGATDVAVIVEPAESVGAGAEVVQATLVAVTVALLVVPTVGAGIEVVAAIELAPIVDPAETPSRLQIDRSSNRADLLAVPFPLAWNSPTAPDVYVVSDVSIVHVPGSALPTFHHRHLMDEPTTRTLNQRWVVLLTPAAAAVATAVPTPDELRSITRTWLNSGSTSMA
jgi:hypothetical protein